MAPIKSHNLPVTEFLMELDLQAWIALRAFEKLEAGTVGWRSGATPEEFGEQAAAPLELLSQSVILLSAAAVVSKILFKGGGKETPRIRNRRRVLRRLLEIEALPTVSALKVRNSFEHVDERLDTWAIETMNRMRQGNAAGVESIKVNALPPKPNTVILKRIAPDALRIHFRDDSVDLRACADELSEVRDGVKTALLKLTGDRIDLYEDEEA